MTLLPLKLLNLISSLFLLSLDLSYTETLSISVVQLWVVPTPPNWNWLLQIPPSSMTPRTPFLLESHLIWILGWSNEKLYGPMHVQLKGFPQMAFLSIVLEVLITGLVGALNVDTQPGPQSICRYGPVLSMQRHRGKLLADWGFCFLHGRKLLVALWSPPPCHQVGEHLAAASFPCWERKKKKKKSHAHFS